MFIRNIFPRTRFVMFVFYKMNFHFWETFFNYVIIDKITTIRINYAYFIGIFITYLYIIQFFYAFNQ